MVNCNNCKNDFEVTEEDRKVYKHHTTRLHTTYKGITDGYRDITDSMGAIDTEESGSTHNGTGKSLDANVPHLHVRITNFTIKQVAESRILKYTLEMLETA